MVHVECYEDERGESIPRCFDIGQRRVAVVEVVDRWFEPERHYFKLRGDDHALYILQHDMEAGGWDITVYDSDTLADFRLSSS